MNVTVPIFAAVNLTQNYMFGVAVLRMAMKELRIKKATSKLRWGTLGLELGAKFMKNQALAAAYQTAKIRGVVSPNIKGIDSRTMKILNDIYGEIKRQQHLGEAVTDLTGSGMTFDKTLARIADTSGFMFSATENNNRLSAAMTFVQEVGDKYKSDKALERATLDFLDDVHFSYEKRNQPYWLKLFPSLTRPLVFGLQNYNAQSWQLLHHLDARGKMGWLIAMMTFMGLPAEDMWEWIWTRLFGTPLRETVEETVGETASDIFFEGLVTQLTRVDMSGSLDLDLPPLLNVLADITGVKRSKGPFQSMVSNLVMTLFGQKRLIDNAPLAMKSLFQGVEETTSGLKTSSGKFISEDGERVKLTVGQGILKSLGFNPLERSRFKNHIWRVRKFNTYLADKRRAIADAYTNDQSDANFEKVDEFNTALADLMDRYGLVITTRPIDKSYLKSRDKDTNYNTGRRR